MEHIEFVLNIRLKFVGLSPLYLYFKVFLFFLGNCVTSRWSLLHPSRRDRVCYIIITMIVMTCTLEEETINLRDGQVRAEGR